MKIVTSERIPIKMWLDDIEDGALEQAKNLANLPFAFKHIAIMPDSHQGYGMPIGGVLATENVVIPNAVGVDIGCGMCAVKTSLRSITTEEIKKIFGGSKDYHGGIRSCVPVGFSHHSKKQDHKFMPVCSPDLPIVSHLYEEARTQVGTLGGGNHFIEIQKGSDGYIWIMLHSGSRNIGYKVAKHYNQLAKEQNFLWHSAVSPKVDLAFFPIQSKFGELYLSEMNYCLEFALASRKLMMERVKESIIDTIKHVHFNKLINIHHNYATMENHFGRNVMVHRKGATLARENTIGIIPGSQGTKSYIVKGKGNRDSFMSCSHGAGRKMGRKEACRKLNLEEEVRKLNEQRIIHSIRSQEDLDEASGAYKSIETVMENQKDLVEILVELSPLAVIKG